MPLGLNPNVGLNSLDFLNQGLGNQFTTNVSTPASEAMGNFNFGNNRPDYSLSSGMQSLGMQGSPNQLPLNFGNQSNSSGLGMNLPTLQLGAQGLGSLASLIGGFQANRLARDQFNFSKDFANTNLKNQTQSYNTALEDRARSRYGWNQVDNNSVADYVNRNKMVTR